MIQGRNDQALKADVGKRGFRTASGRRCVGPQKKHDSSNHPGLGAGRMRAVPGATVKDWTQVGSPGGGLCNLPKKDCRNP